MGKNIVTLSGLTLLIGTIGYIILNPVAHMQFWNRRHFQWNFNFNSSSEHGFEYTSPPNAAVYTRQVTVSTESTTLSVEQTNIIRKRTIKEYCEKRGKRKPLNETISLWKKQGVDIRPRMYYSDNMKLVFCETPKCGTTQWRNLMLIIDGHLKGYENSPDVDYYPLARKKIFLWNDFNLTNATDAKALETKLQNYFTMMTTREPLERLVSAFRDKLETGKNSAYRPVSMQIHRIVTKDKSRVGKLATFEEFIDYILRIKRRAVLDPHWKPYSELCDPCSVEYDYIARMETVYDDAAYITGHFGIDRDRIYNSTGRGDAQERRNKLFYEYFEKLPSTKRYAIFNYYKDQYDMFGYEYPKFINKSSLDT